MKAGATIQPGNSRTGISSFMDCRETIPEMKWSLTTMARSVNHSRPVKILSAMMAKELGMRKCNKEVSSSRAVSGKILFARATLYDEPVADSFNGYDFQGGILFQVTA